MTKEGESGDKRKIKKFQKEKVKKETSLFNSRDRQTDRQMDRRTD